jgi:hypothetical protein
MNNTTKRYPRTLDEAFGPYQRHGLQEQYSHMPKEDRIVVIASVIALAALGLMAVMGWLA